MGAEERGAETGGSYPGEEVFDAEHPIKHVFFEVPGATRLAVVYSGFERAHKPKYNYIERLKPLPATACTSSTTWARAGATTSARDRDFFVARAIADARRPAGSRQLGLTRERRRHVGSSKGGTAALHHALAFGYGEAIAAAPQVLLAKYLTETVQARDVSRPDRRRRHARRTTRSSTAFLLERVAASPYRPRLHFFISREDSHYEDPPAAAAGGARRQGARRTRSSSASTRRTRPSASRSASTCSSALGTRSRAGMLRGPRRATVTARTSCTSTPAVPEAGERARDRALPPRLPAARDRATSPQPRARGPRPPAGRLAARPRIGRYTLRFDRTWTCSQAGRATYTRCAARHRHPRRPPRAARGRDRADLATALRRSQEAFYDLLDHLCGAHVVLFRIGDRHVLLKTRRGWSPSTTTSPAAPACSRSTPG